MGASQFVKLYLGPMLVAGVATVAMAGTSHPQASDSSAVLPAVALLGMLSLSVGTMAWVRRERRRNKRD